MTKAELIAAMNENSAALLKVVEGLEESERRMPGAVGQWSVHDVVGHIGYWDGEALKAFPNFFETGCEPYCFEIKEGELDHWNDRAVQERRAWSWERVLEEFFTVRGRTMALLDEINDEDLKREGTYPWSQVGPLGKLILIDLDHEREHIEALRKWRAKIKPGA
ncbi:MAG: ClbS/DfsB family four-helix bundle protein [Chloroflexi bacterium]|nr:ClbS/DfsB family four-helix bundle protein [Chloroflexota bacterium]